MPYEAWIWTELLAFDHASPDQGVDAYLEGLGFVPKGISLMASASDFVMLHEPLTEERPLFPDVCTRFGHAGNEERSRQEWTNFELRSLVAHLRARGIEVFVSVFAAYHHDRFHKEWLSDHPEASIVYADLGVTDGVQVLARLADGTYYEDLFAEQLARVIEEYGFDGWHGPDCFGPSGSLGHSDCSDGMVAQFADTLGERCPPGLAAETGHEVARLQERMEFIWRHLRDEWIAFHLDRWETFWRKMVDAVRPLGARTMINSANTKAAFESMFIYGMDYRRIARLGVDYLVVETVAANLALINGGYERHFEFAATLAEMKALVPEMKVIFLHGVKDVVESYDLMRHAPGRLEREVFTLANQMIRGADGKLRRCADGFMVCLGDGLAPWEWQYLRRQWDAGYSFEPVRAGDLTWVWSESTTDGLMSDYPLHGTWAGYRQVAHLVENEGVQVHTICRIENLAQVSGPILVPNADLLAPEELHAVLRYRGGPIVLLGNLKGEWVAGEAGVVRCDVSDGYEMACVVLGSALEPMVTEVPRDEAPAFCDDRPPCFFWFRPNAMAIPDQFWACAGSAIRRAVEVWEGGRRVRNCHPGVREEGLCTLALENAEGVLRVALVSRVPTYLSPTFALSGAPVGVAKVSGFPYTPLAVEGDTVRSGHNNSPLHVPPYGTIVMDVSFGNGE